MRILASSIFFLSLTLVCLGEEMNDSDISDSCRKTIVEIQKDLGGLKKVFPVLNNIDGATLAFSDNQGSEEAQAAETFMRFSLKYRKGTKIEKIKPDSQGRIPSSDERLVFDPEGGVVLDIFITNSPVLNRRTKSYPISKAKNLELFYNLDITPSDKDLEKAVKAVIERNVAKLRQILTKAD